MKFPNKVISYEESILSKLTVILNVLSRKDESLIELYYDTQKYFIDMPEFIDTIECLFVLNKVDYNEDLEVLHYVGWNMLWKIS